MEISPLSSAIFSSSRVVVSLLTFSSSLRSRGEITRKLIKFNNRGLRKTSRLIAACSLTTSTHRFQYLTSYRVSTLMNSFRCRFRSYVYWDAGEKKCRENEIKECSRWCLSIVQRYNLVLRLWEENSGDVEDEILKIWRYFYVLSWKNFIWTGYNFMNGGNDLIWLIWWNLMYVIRCPEARQSFIIKFSKNTCIRSSKVHWRTKKKL